MPLVKLCLFLFERTGKKEGQLQGRTPFYQAINVPANERLLGQIVNVKVTEATPNALVGEVEMVEAVLKILQKPPDFVV